MAATNRQASSTNKAIIAKLTELGGGQFRPEDDIVSEGTKLIIPQGMDMTRAAKVLMERVHADEELVSFNRSYKYRPWDGAVCTWRALKRVFGIVSSKPTMGFFGPNPPEMRDIPVGPDTHETVPWGSFALPVFENTTFYTYSTTDPELGVLFALSVEGPRKYRSAFEGIFQLVQDELETASIYRGKAFDGQEQPEFLDLSGVDHSKVIYSEDTMTQLEANIWAVLRHREALERVGISRKRAALLYGPYGTGKTLGGFLTAKESVENGWTFIYARPGKDDVAQTLQTAKLYQPCCVFFEDLDTVSDPEDGTTTDKATRLLDAFDGISSKGTEVMVVLTTNHADRIHKGMLRPGRLDAVIEVGALDQKGIQRLMEAVLPDGAIDSAAIGWVEVADAAEGMLPAYIKEAADRAYRYALARTGKPEGIKLTTSDLVGAAHGLRPQLALMEGANDTASRDTLGEALSRQVEGVITPQVKTALVETYTESEHGRAFKPEVVKEVVKAARTGNGRN